MNILVTGSQGKLGSLAVGLLKKAGHEVQGYDVRQDPAQDILDPGALQSAMAGCAVVVHCAALPHPNKGPLDRYWQVNVVGTKNVVDTAIAAGVRRLVYTSSTGFYGCDMRAGFIAPAYLPIDEAHVPAPFSGQIAGELDEYNTSKVLAEALLAYHGTNGHIEVLVLRIAPANTKAQQYPKGLPAWRECRDWRRGALFANCAPAKAAEALALATLWAGTVRHEVFIVCDRYVHADIDIPAFVRQAYPAVPVRGRLGQHAALFSTAKIQQWWGWRPRQTKR